METSALGGSGTTATTARHRPTPDSSAPPHGAPAHTPRPVESTESIASNEPCDLVTVPARQGLEAVDILRRGAAPAVAPVLHDGACDTLGFLVPPGTADGWDMPGSACTQTAGRGLRLPEEPPVTGSGWLLPPDGTDPVTDPVVLREALGEAARLIEAADNCS
ncbi:hypothetical protein OH805_23730 [Streptomyces sp. NBC_00879]|uniref:hypothetical protein n=1 Tax=unclassified Streptomyces TaxID=2593676 RepID=UPI00386B8BBB|nr:hypothetical protein OHA61_24865 [Streptomyces sp. NBC_00885]WSY76909.1 hypothetical protein OH805_23730 [Streptomyces sp. NBC_00879]